jgi:methylmalonyl-CoA mutase
MKGDKLFTGFPPVPTERWEEVITADLKGADYEKKLVWRTREGFSVRPYYRAEDLAGLKYLGAAIGQFPYVRGTGGQNRWQVSQTIAVRDDAAVANHEALRAIEGGADAIDFRVETKDVCLKTLLAGIDLSKTEVTLSGGGANELGARALEWAKASGVEPMSVRLNVALDPICTQLTLGGRFTCCENGCKCFAQIADLVRAQGEYKKMRFVTVAGHNFGDAGATIVQELAFTLAAGHEYLVRLMEAGLTADQAAHTLRFSMGVSANYFMEIAKLRAARMLWATIVRQYKPEKACAEKMRIHAVSSRWNMTVYDAYVNMLRGTTEAMSAAIGGVYSMEVLPFDAAYEPATEFSSRIARNVQLLLKHESHFDNVTDPSGGSYYIETLTQNIAEQAWALFKQVEDKGGYIAAFGEGFVRETIEGAAAAKDKEVATRRIVLLGTNQYPNFNETADDAVGEKTVVAEGEEGGLRLVRGAMPFERMRLHVDRSGRNPKVFLLTCGTLGMARARAQFATNFFGCAGFRIEDNTFFKTVQEGVQAAIASKAAIVVICAADDDYATLAPEAFKLLDGHAMFVVAGAPASQPDLEAAGIRNFISVRSNVLTTLEQYVKELGI